SPFSPPPPPPSVSFSPGEGGSYQNHLSIPGALTFNLNLSRGLIVEMLRSIDRALKDRGSSVKERLTFNLKQLGKKTPTRSRPSAAKGKSGVRSGPEVKTGTRHDREEAHLTLTLTPEAVLLLQRRDSERRQRSATRKAKSSAAEGSGSSTESRCRKDNGSRRHQLALPGHVTPRPRDQVTGDAVAEQGDIRSILKISLLNEQHKYDDVEYEEEDGGVDERVVLKCTEWLRGLENTPTRGRAMKMFAMAKVETLAEMKKARLTPARLT
uniref:Proline rich 18 n=1 Tax=Cynoglossus semilaevis TaxID=244447 RepID=A0A3P8UJW6_CYNSE